MASAFDDFNRADASTLGANWTVTLNGMVVHTAVGGAHEAGAQVSELLNAAYYSGISFTNNHYAEGLFQSHGGASMCLTVRHQSGGNFYFLYLSGVSGLTVRSYISGAQTTLQDLGTAYVDGHTYRVSAEGSSPTTLTVYDNGSPVGSPLTDSTSGLQSGGAPGIGAVHAEGGWDSWTGSDIGVVGGQPTIVRHQQTPHHSGGGSLVTRGAGRVFGKAA